MAKVSFDQLALYGVIKDTPDYKVPPEGWTSADNVRYVDGAVEKMVGWQEVFGTPPVSPAFVLGVRTPAQMFWPYVSLTKGYVWDGLTHTDITRTVGGDYTAVHSSEWHGFPFGGIPIFNNGIDVPQFWAPPSSGTKMADMTNWPATLRAKRLASLKGYLIGIDITDSGTRYPHRVKWSDVAVPGSLPGSWDESDPTVDAGETDLPDVDSGTLQDLVRLRDRMFLYKSNSIWSMRFIGGRFVFAIDPYLETVGILAPGCAVAYGRGFRHFVVTEDDIIIHTGQGEPVSVGDRRMRRTLFNSINSTNFHKSFAFHNLRNREVWFCYPSSASEEVDTALVWAYEEGNGAGAFSEVPVDFTSAAYGIVETSDLDDWDSDSETWDDDETSWSNSSRIQTIVTSRVNDKFMQLNTSFTMAGEQYISTLQRTGLAVVGRQRDGQWKVSFQQRKFVYRLWPEMRGTLEIRLGTQETVEDDVSWTDYQTFNSATDLYLDFELEGRAICVEFRDADVEGWRLEGYNLELELSGEI